MDEIREAKRTARNDITGQIKEMPEEERNEKYRQIRNRLFEFANFMEARIPLLYMNYGCEFPTKEILSHCYALHKVVVLPLFGRDKFSYKLLKIDNPAKDLKPEGPRGVSEPNPKRCKAVPIDKLDIALIPCVALDEKGSRLGSGDGHYDRLIPKMSVTTRKVAVAMECQILPQIPLESHDKHVDIIITEERIIYKI